MARELKLFGSQFDSHRQAQCFSAGPEAPLKNPAKNFLMNPSPAADASRRTRWRSVCGGRAGDALVPKPPAVGFEAEESGVQLGFRALAEAARAADPIAPHPASAERKTCWRSLSWSARLPIP